MELKYLWDHYEDPVVIKALQTISHNVASGDFPSAGLTLGLLLSKRFVKSPSVQDDPEAFETGDEGWGFSGKRNRKKGMQ